MANGLTTEQIDAMLGKLASDDTYRTLFTQDLGAALAQLPGAPTVPWMAGPGCCLRPAKLVSKEVIAQTRQTLLQRLDTLEPFIPKLLEQSP
jgi:putative modified peptide